MRITIKRLVESGCRSREDLSARLAFWASRYGFLRIEDDENTFIFSRGSHWQALYTFDIRKVPTTVTVEMRSDKDGLCQCGMTCGSWLQISAPRDQQRLSEQMDLLEACLKGAISGQQKFAESAVIAKRSNEHRFRAE
jgi:hypothetical protein